MADPRVKSPGEAAAFLSATAKSMIVSLMAYLIAMSVMSHSLSEPQLSALSLAVVSIVTLSTYVIVESLSLKMGITRYWYSATLFTLGTLSCLGAVVFMLDSLAPVFFATIFVVVSPLYFLVKPGRAPSYKEINENIEAGRD